ncbi:hypothetical protein LY78DRAFT_443915 [Colletotrichum sublineola]|nr:hypothetical protein LY78DRAFT_443915 [Colletotrichum sublineola]
MLPDTVRATNNISSDEVLEQQDEPSTTMPERSTLSECACLSSSVGRLLTWTCIMLPSFAGAVRYGSLILTPLVQLHGHGCSGTDNTVGAVCTRSRPSFSPCLIRPSSSARFQQRDTDPGIILASDQRILPRWVHGVAWLGLWLEPGPVQGPGTGPVAEEDQGSSSLAAQTGLG